jgi:hypothetical protein
MGATGFAGGKKLADAGSEGVCRVLTGGTGRTAPKPKSRGLASGTKGCAVGAATTGATSCLSLRWEVGRTGRVETSEETECFEFGATDGFAG